MLTARVPVHDLPSRKKEKKLSVVCSFLRKKNNKLDSKYVWVFFLILFIYLRPCWVFIACTWAFSSCDKPRPLSNCSVRASHCSGLSGCRAWALGYVGSVVVAHRLSCPTTCGIFPDQFPALAGRLIFYH